jgi:hypothetical protein
LIITVALVVAVAGYFGFIHSNLVKACDLEVDQGQSKELHSKLGR